MPVYRRVWLALLVSNLGSFLQLTAAPWVMLELTDSPLMVSLVTTALTLPQLLLTIPSGAIADAFDRRTVMIVGHVTSAGAAAVMSVLAVTDSLTPTGILVLSFALGTGSAIGLPAFQTLVPDLVGDELRAQAITLNSAAFNVARAVGPSIGGAFVALGLAATSFGGNAVSYLVVVGVLLTVPRQLVEETSRPPVWRSAATGMRYVRFTRPLPVLLVVTALFVLTGTSLQALLPSVSADALGLDAAGFGLLYGAFGLGAIVAAFTRETARLRLGRRMLPVSIIVFGASGVTFGVSTSPLLSGLALAGAGLGWVWTLVTLNATVQILAPRWVRSRVMSLYVLAVGIQPLGALGAGAVAEFAGAGTSVAVFTAATALLGLVALRVDLPVLGEVSGPTVPEGWVVPVHADDVVGSPIVVSTTWQIVPADLETFLLALRDLRRERLRTGAHKWEVFRDAADPFRITEQFTVHSWEEHLAQHARIDVAAADAIALARGFDCADGPVTVHLAGIDASAAGAAFRLDRAALAEHGKLHASDGSVPLQS